MKVLSNAGLKDFESTTKSITSFLISIYGPLSITKNLRRAVLGYSPSIFELFTTKTAYGIFLV